METFLIIVVGIAVVIGLVGLISKENNSPKVQASRQDVEDEDDDRWQDGPNVLPRIERGESVENFSKRRRQMAINWAKKVLDQKDKYVILDTETTGLGENDVIIQLAVIDIEGNPIINTLIKPSKRKRISTESTEIHGIKIGDLKDAPTLLEIVDELEAAVKGKKAIIYNAEFDERMLFQTMIQDDFRKFIKFRMNCAMKHYAAFVGQYSEYHGDFKFQRLPGGDHTAGGDCLATLEVIKKMAMYEEPIED